MGTQGGKTTARYPNSAEPADSRPYLVVVRDGRHDGRLYELPAGKPFLIGRLETCDLIVPPEDDSVSREHARIELGANGSVVLRDLSTTNGSFLDGLRVNEATVPNHGRIRLGSTARYRVDWLTEDEANQQGRGFINALTGCLSREAFDADLADMRARSIQDDRDLAMVILDIDHFGEFNKRHGMPVGDLVLEAVSACLREEAQQRDCPAYRLGGEEFAILLPASDLEEARARAEKMRLQLENLVVEHEGQPLAVTGSFGCAVLAASEEVNDRELLRRADQRLREAKQGGRNRVEPCPG